MRDGRLEKSETEAERNTALLYMYNVPSLWWSMWLSRKRRATRVVVDSKETRNVVILEDKGLNFRRSAREADVDSSFVGSLDAERGTKLIEHIAQKIARECGRRRSRSDSERSSTVAKVKVYRSELKQRERIRAFHIGQIEVRR